MTVDASETVAASINNPVADFSRSLMNPSAASFAKAADVKVGAVVSRVIVADVA